MFTLWRGQTSALGAILLIISHKLCFQGCTELEGNHTGKCDCITGLRWQKAVVGIKPAHLWGIVIPNKKCKGYIHNWGLYQWTCVNNKSFQFSKAFAEPGINLWQIHMALAGAILWFLQSHSIQSFLLHHLQLFTPSWLSNPSPHLYLASIGVQGGD